MGQKPPPCRLVNGSAVTARLPIPLPKTYGKAKAAPRPAEKDREAIDFFYRPIGFVDQQCRINGAIRRARTLSFQTHELAFPRRRSPGF
jgi:hypothetical protein